MATLEQPDFASMEIGTLRQYASHLKLPLEKTAKKDEIIDLIQKKLKNKAMPEIVTAASKLKPGYSRIIVASDPTPGAANNPVYLYPNGIAYTVPRDVEIIVPNRIVRALADSKVLRKRQTVVTDNQGREKTTNVDTVVQCYPFQLLEKMDGPEVLTPYEEGKLRHMGPKNRYRAMFGRWPKPRELTRAIEQKLIKLHEDEVLGAAEEKLMGTEDTAEQ